MNSLVVTWIALIKYSTYIIVRFNSVSNLIYLFYLQNYKDSQLSAL